MSGERRTHYKPLTTYSPAYFGGTIHVVNGVTFVHYTSKSPWRSA